MPPPEAPPGLARRRSNEGVGEELVPGEDPGVVRPPGEEPGQLGGVVVAVGETQGGGRRVAIPVGMIIVLLLLLLLRQPVHLHPLRHLDLGELRAHDEAGDHGHGGVPLPRLRTLLDV